MTSKAATVEQYLAELPDDRRETISAIRNVILANLDSEFEEGMLYGGICYYVPHRVYPPGYHCDPKMPLTYAGIGNQKHHVGIYLFCIYHDEGISERFRKEWTKTVKRLDMGRGCVRVRKLEDVALEAIGETIRRTTARKLIEFYESEIRPKRKRK